MTPEMRARIEVWEAKVHADYELGMLAIQLLKKMLREDGPLTGPFEIVKPEKPDPTAEAMDRRSRGRSPAHPPSPRTRSGRGDGEARRRRGSIMTDVDSTWTLNQGTGGEWPDVRGDLGDLRAENAELLAARDRLSDEVEDTNIEIRRLRTENVELLTRLEEMCRAAGAWRAFPELLLRSAHTAIEKAGGRT